MLLCLAMKSPQDTHQTLRLRTCEGKLSSDSRGSFQYPDKSSTHIAVQHVRAKDESTNSITCSASQRFVESPEELAAQASALASILAASELTSASLRKVTTAVVGVRG